MRSEQPTQRGARDPDSGVVDPGDRWDWSSTVVVLLFMVLLLFLTFAAWDALRAGH